MFTLHLMGVAQQKYRLKPMIRWVESEERATILNLRSGRCYELNKTGATIWTSLIEGDNIKDLVRNLAAGGDVSARRVRDDVLEFLDKLIQLRFIEKMDGERAGTNQKRYK